MKVAPKSRQLILERFEEREVPAVVSISLDPAGVLMIRADDTPTNVSVQQITVGVGAAAIRQYRVTHGTPLLNPRLFGAAAVRSIQFIGGSAADTFTASTARVPVTAMGNDGNDNLTGGLSASTIDGGPGNDTIRGELGHLLRPIRRRHHHHRPRQRLHRGRPRRRHHQFGRRQRRDLRRLGQRHHRFGRQQR